MLRVVQYSQIYLFSFLVVLRIKTGTGNSLKIYENDINIIIYNILQKKRNFSLPESYDKQFFHYCSCYWSVAVSKTQKYITIFNK